MPLENQNNIEGIVKKIEKSSSNSKEQKEYAKKILESAIKKRIDTIALSSEAKSKLDFLLKDMSIDSETAINRISDSLSTKAKNNNTLSDISGYTEEYESPEDKEAEKAFKNAERERGEEGWTELYVIAKMISLGYIPKLHDMKYQKEFKGQKIKWVWNNAKYTSVGGPITNGTINNEVFKKMQAETNAWILKQVFSEESQIKILLTQVQNSNFDKNIKSKLNERVNNLNDIKASLNSGNNEHIRDAFNNYKRISGETPDVLRKQINDSIERVKANQEKALNDSINKKTNEVKNSLETIQSNAKNETINSLDAEISKIDKEINTTINPLNTEIEKLENEKTSIEELNTNIKKEETKLETLKAERRSILKENSNDNVSKIVGAYGEKIEKTPTKLEKQINTDISSIEKEIEALKKQRSKSEKKNKKIDEKIEEKRKEIGLAKNSDKIKALEIRKQSVNAMKSDIESGKIKDFESKKNDYEKSHKIDGIKDSNINNLSQNKEKILEIKTAEITKTETDLNKTETDKKIIDERNNVTQKEITRINEEFRKIEEKINDLKIQAEVQLRDFDNTAKNHPEQIPELKQKAEALVEKHNREIANLEALGVKNVKGLNMEQLKGVAKDSKLLTRIANANNGLDKLSSGVTGKILGVGAIILIANGLKGAYDKDGLSKETALNAADIGIGIIPVVGGIHDLYRAYEGTDLNGKEMSSEERWMRTGFGIVGLIPGLGTAVKWAAASGKIVKTANGTSKVMETGEVIVQGGNLLGKSLSLGALGYTAVSTTYTLPEHTLKK